MRLRFHLKAVYIALWASLLVGDVFATEKINVVIPGNIFCKSRKSDILVSLRELGNMLNDRIKEDVDVNYIIEDDVEVIRKGLKEEQIDALVVLSPEFVSLEKTEAFQKLRLLSGTRNVRKEVLMVVDADSEYSEFDDLRGKRVAVAYQKNMKVAQLWHETFLFERGIGAEENFYSEVHYKKNGSQAVLSVFFGKTDACFVSRASYEMIKEMNPQVGRKLTVLASSPSYATTVLAVRETYKKPFVDEIFSIIDEVCEDSKGQHILMRDHLVALVKADSTDLDTVRVLVNQHDVLEQSLPENGNKNAGTACVGRVFGLRERY